MSYKPWKNKPWRVSNSDIGAGVCDVLVREIPVDGFPVEFRIGGYRVFCECDGSVPGVEVSLVRGINCNVAGVSHGGREVFYFLGVLYRDCPYWLPVELIGHGVCDIMPACSAPAYPSAWADHFPKWAGRVFLLRVIDE